MKTIENEREVLYAVEQILKDKDIQSSCMNSFKSPEKIHELAVVITHLAFRKGPVESMHKDPNSPLTDENMKKLNKYMVNVLAYIFGLVVDFNWIKLNYIVEKTKHYGCDWDRAEPNDLGFDELFEEAFKKEIERKLEDSYMKISQDANRQKNAIAS